MQYLSQPTKKCFFRTKAMKIKALLLLLLISNTGFYNLFGQYSPGVGLPGCTAMYKDSSAFVNWANACKIKRGLQDISNTSLGYASTGDSTLALGKAESNGVVSLGDGGYAICTFPFPIKNGSGPDFAVFENGFDNDFLELALVEVSSDGQNYFRFKAHSLSDTLVQTTTFGYTNAVKLNNLAGKFKSGYGTPFDLQELSGIAGLNINAITHIKIIDVVGSLNKMYATYDGYGNKINDPWPTPFPSGGFDLDAIGVINQEVVVGLVVNNFSHLIDVYPNPASNGQIITIKGLQTVAGVELINYAGQVLLSCNCDSITVNNLPLGIYFLKIHSGTQGTFLKKVILQN